MSLESDRELLGEFAKALAVANTKFKELQRAGIEVSLHGINAAGYLPGFGFKIAAANRTTVDIILAKGIWTPEGEVE